MIAQQIAARCFVMIFLSSKIRRPKRFAYVFQLDPERNLGPYVACLLPLDRSAGVVFATITAAPRTALAEP
jgi:hypothetical protein